MSIQQQRQLGILFPISAMPSNEGIGTMGEEAYRLIDIFHQMGAKVWQILPMGPTSLVAGSSPYMSPSTVAGNPLCISIKEMMKEGFLPQGAINYLHHNNSCDACGRVKYQEVTKQHMQQLKISFQMISDDVRRQVDEFVKENEDWLPDYALFSALHEHLQKPMWQWDKDIRDRKEDAVEKYRAKLKEQIQFEEYCQYLFFRQWRKLKEYAEKHEIKILGDVPIYVSADSVDVWCNPELFKLCEDKSPNKVAGVPPDYYSEDGQLWGSPVYDWSVHKATNYKWWIWRLKHASKMFDIIRIDHFRGLLQYWEVPAGEKTARNGQWCNAPALEFINTIKEKLPHIEFVAEDLGIIGEDVRQFVKDSGFPGMKVLVFGIEARQDNEHLPHHSEGAVYYSSTHDSETLREKLDGLDDENRDFIIEYLMAKDKGLSLDMLQPLFCSSSPLLIIPFWDLLLLGKEARFNTPGTVGDHNWTVRLTSYKGLEAIADKIRKMAQISKRYDLTV